MFEVTYKDVKLFVEVIHQARIFGEFSLSTIWAEICRAANRPYTTIYEWPNDIFDIVFRAIHAAPGWSLEQIETAIMNCNSLDRLALEVSKAEYQLRKRDDTQTCQSN